MFESFLSDLVHWWSGRFRLEPTMVANSALRHPIRILQPLSSQVQADEWMAGSLRQHPRESNGIDAKRREQQRYKDAKDASGQGSYRADGKSKGKGKAKDTSLDGSSSSSSDSLKPPTKAMEITIFAPGSAIRPIYLRLLPAAEQIASPADLKDRAIERLGSRETSAQLFCALCRSIGIPARLVVSPQPLSWSVGCQQACKHCAARQSSREEAQQASSTSERLEFTFQKLQVQTNA